MHYFREVCCVTAAWSAAASYAPSLLPRTPVQQSAATGVAVASHYAIGATLWSAIATTAAGLPGSFAGNQALLTAAAVSASGGKLLEVQLRDESAESLLYGAAWSQAKLLSVVGLAGGLVTASDVVKLSEATTAQGSDIDISVKGSSVMVDNANVVKTDVMASNGVIHVIDTVIIPAS